MAEQTFDLVVVGGGPGGYVAAIRAAQLGMKAALVERDQLGGICLNWGCIPTKALLRSADIMDTLHHLKDFGLEADNIRFDTAAVVKRSRQVANQLSRGVAHLLKKNKVTVIEGTARLAGQGTLAVELKAGGQSQVKAKYIILATGARARQLPGLEADGKLIWTYREALVPQVMPKSLLVVGSGAIGIEFASFYRSMGVDVTVVEALPRVLPVEDEEISAFAHKQFEKRGIKIRAGVALKALEKGTDSVTASIEVDGKAEKIQVDRVIMAVGIVGNVENLGLETTKVKVDRTHIVVDQYCRTDEPGIYAIGDIVGAPWLAHKASHEGVMCVEKIAGLEHVHTLDVTKIPGCTYCTPQVASVGLTEKAAKDAGYEVKVGRFPFIGNGKAIALGEPEGMVKTIFDAKSGELLGAHMVGAEVTELIQGYVIARTMEATEEDLFNTIFPHPTLSEMMHESALDAYGRAIHF
ncbi:dihydrolipoamide dehydrogenase [Arboricoccus pini]|uniref:Dihydrolipoyl dehydrogenase n=1 Tax=Arboricoccus pini TaxID=1963835 RepID=A0A212QPA7_9PROT|nr:dihydrolipoyl dehydrogenase [Arboricoccus pini]SNB61108.1 dihydrolipoamide dehydrogenase [Arboricoccus pini]